MSGLSFGYIVNELRPKATVTEMYVSQSLISTEILSPVSAWMFIDVDIVVLSFLVEVDEIIIYSLDLGMGGPAEGLTTEYVSIDRNFIANA